MPGKDKEPVISGLLSMLTAFVYIIILMIPFYRDTFTLADGVSLSPVKRLIKKDRVVLALWECLLAAVSPAGVEGLMTCLFLAILFVSSRIHPGYGGGLL